MTSKMLTPDFLKSQLASGASYGTIADLVAKKDPKFSTQLQNVRIASAKYDNPDDLVKSFVNFHVYGDATYDDTQPDTTPEGAYSVDEIRQDPSVMGRVGKQAWNVGNSLVRTAGTVAKETALLPFTNANTGERSLNVADNLISQVQKPIDAAVDYGTAIAGSSYEGITGKKLGPDTPVGQAQKRVDEGFLNQTLGTGDLIKATFGPTDQTIENLQSGAEKTVKTLQEDPGKTALALSPLTGPRPVGEGKLGPISTASDKIGQGIDAAATKIKESADKSVQAARQQFVRDLVKPVDSKAARLDSVARTTEKGRGPFKRSVVAPSPKELAMEQALTEVKDVSPSNTYQGNYNAVQKTVSQDVEALRASLDLPENNFQIKKSELKGSIRKAARSLEESPTLVGDAQTSANRIVAKLERMIDQAEGDSAVIHGNTVLRVRQELDAWVKSQKPNMYDPNAPVSALKMANKSMRDVLNDTMDRYAPNAEVKTALSRQHSLLNALDVLEEKAAAEANTAVGRFMQKVQAKLGKVRVFPGALGAAGAAGAIYIAPSLLTTVTGLGAAGLAGYEGLRLLMAPKLRYAMSNALKALEKVAITDPSVRPLIQEGNAIINGDILDIPLDQLESLDSNEPTRASNLSPDQIKLESHQ